jgi:sugar/nucleoside kinase (ribokinase family)
VPACSVKAIDSTGAGDLWAAGFLYGWLKGWPLHSAAELGAKVAAAVVQVTGAVIPDEVWASIRRDLPT